LTGQYPHSTSRPRVLMHISLKTNANLRTVWLVQW